MITKTVMGILTILPGIYCLGFVVFISTVFVSPWDPPLESFIGLFAFHLSAMILVLGLLVFYLRHVFSNSALSSEQKMLWAIVLLLGHVVAMPIYWFNHIYRSSDGVRA